MTENKRFTHKKWYDERQLFDGEEAFAIVDSGTQASILCNKLNKLYDENEQLKQEIKKLETFKKILDYAEKDMEERVDWQSYCEKEFEGL